MVLMLGPSVGASPSSEEFLIEAIQEGKENPEIKAIAPVRPWPVAPPALETGTPPVPSKLIEVVQGAASWNEPGFLGRTTANGERSSKGTLMAAHRTLTFGNKVRITNLSNG